MRQDVIAIIDCGSHENAALAREIRACKIYSEIYPHDITVDELKAIANLKGIIVNHGPNNIVNGQPISVAEEVLALPLPIAQFADGETNSLSAFLRTVEATYNWSMPNFIADRIEDICAEVGDKKVLLALSGGVDSSVVAALLEKAIGKNLYCVHVNHGLLRKGEAEQVISVFRPILGDNLIYVDAVDRFLNRLQGVADPEEKRKIIGAEFIRVFEEEARKLNGIEFLAQGTIYPDIIESGTKTAQAVKAHHNVGGLPDDLNFKLIEPLKYLFKDEVRACGTALGLPKSMVYRQPFPGPGLGVRCLGAITRDRLEIVRESDAILREEFELCGLSETVWQYFTAVPDFKSTGVRNNARAFEYPVILRAVNTVDAMTATIEQIDWSILQKITNRILAEVPGCCRVLYDLSPKPIATIEWE